MPNERISYTVDGDLVMTEAGDDCCTHSGEISSVEIDVEDGTVCDICGKEMRDGPESDCEDCGAPDAPLRALTDSWGSVYEREHLCDACWEREPEPDLNAVSAGERWEMESRAKRAREGR